MVTEVAVPVQIYADSHSSLYVGLAGLAGLIPITVFGLYGGASPTRWTGAGSTCGRRW